MTTYAYTPELLIKLKIINEELRQRFSSGSYPFQTTTRLLEERGEIAAEVNHFEGSGTKRQKHGEPDNASLATEAQQVIRCVLQLIDYYDAHTEFEESIEDSCQPIIVGEI